MKRPLLAVAVIACAPALADHSTSVDSSTEPYYVYADVVDVDPIVTHRIVRTAREVCDQPTRYARHDHDYDTPIDREYEPGPGPSIIGGLIGGLIGHQLGRGSGRKALTVAGAIAGASIANASARANATGRHHGRYARRYRSTECRMVTDAELVRSTQGYRVTYDYHGRRFVKDMETYPDEQIRIRVQISPEFQEEIQ